MCVCAREAEERSRERVAGTILNRRAARWGKWGAAIARQRGGSPAPCSAGAAQQARANFEQASPGWGTARASATGRWPAPDERLPKPRDRRDRSALALGHGLRVGGSSGSVCAVGSATASRLAPREVRARSVHDAMDSKRARPAAPSSLAS